MLYNNKNSYNSITTQDIMIITDITKKSSTITIYKYNTSKAGQTNPNIIHVSSLTHHNKPKLSLQ